VWPAPPVSKLSGERIGKPRRNMWVKVRSFSPGI
jgi:hypothetical protein